MELARSPVIDRLAGWLGSADWLAGWVDFTPGLRRTILDVVWIMVDYTYTSYTHSCTWKLHVSCYYRMTQISVRLSDNRSKDVFVTIYEVLGADVY